MKSNRFYRCSLAFALITSASNAFAQAPSRQPNAQPTRANQTSNQGVLSFDDYGVQIKPDARLIVVMAALDAAGFNPTPNAQPSLFRQEVRAATANLDAPLRRRLADFFRLQQRASGLSTTSNNRENPFARQAAPYVSLAFALGEAPTFEAPARTDDLPAEVLDVLDFAPLVREFYNRSGIAARLPDLMRAAQTEADAMRPAMANTILTGVGYLKTRPQTSYDERITVTAPSAQNKKSSKNQKQGFTVRERERRFRVVPDPLGVPNTINFRIIGDDYFVALAPGASPASGEVRRAYLQYIIDPLVLRFNRQIALRRLDIKALLDAQLPAGTSTAATVTTATTIATAPTATTSATALFPAVTRSLIAATDARIEETLRFNTLRQETDARLKQVTTDAGRATITRENNEARLAISDRTALALSDAYERGAVLSFYFAEQLRGVEESGFDVVNFLPDMLASFTVPRELSRLAEAKPARERAAAALAARRTTTQPSAAIIEAAPSAASVRNEQLAARLGQIQNLLQLNNYTQAETELLALRDKYQGDPRILFALGQAASASARDATDERIRDERLNRALAHYRFSIESVRVASEPESGINRALLSRAFVSIARILEFQDKNTEARAAFDEAIKIGEVEGGAYREAIEATQNTAKP